MSVGSSPTAAFIATQDAKTVDVDLAEHRLIGVRRAQPERVPGVGELLDGHAELLGGLAQGVDRPARPLQNIAREAEQPAAALGLHHLLGGEAEAVQVFDQRGSLARVGDSGGLQRIEIDHPPESASRDAPIRVNPVSEIQHGPLEERHRQLGASFAEFSGWLMPVSYAGTVGEHTATRTAVGLFDVSHLGKASVRGPGAAEYVNSTLTNDLGRIGPGKAQYTLCCTESGGVIDDLIAYYVSDDEIFLVPNAANTAAVVAALQDKAPGRADHHRRAPVARRARGAGTEIGRGRRIARAADRHGLHGLRRRRLQRRRGAGVPHRLHR